LGSIRPICAHFNAKRCWNPLQRRESGFIQEAPHGGRNRGTRNPIADAATLAQLPRSGRRDGSWRNVPDLANSGKHSAVRAQPPAADTRPGTEPRAASVHRGSNSGSWSGRDRLRERGRAFKQKDGAIPPTSSHAESLGKRA
jgi:hypothetical protein